MAIQNTQLRKDFQRFLYHGPSMLVGRQAEMALRDARTLATWRELESQGLVRLRAEDEQESYFAVFGEPDTKKERDAILHSLETYGNYWCVAEYKSCACECCKHDTWEQADSIGMCAGYKNVLDPFENCYITELMASAIEQAEQLQEAA